MTKHQPAWLWGRRTADEGALWTILDTNNAADSDMWIAYALLEAGRLWNRPDYVTKAHAMMALLKKDVRTVKNLGGRAAPPAASALKIRVGKIESELRSAFYSEALCGGRPGVGVRLGGILKNASEKCPGRFFPGLGHL